MPQSVLWTLLALVIGCGLALGLGLVADRIGLVDRPDSDLKGHGRVVPITGGLAVMAAVQVVLAVAGRFDPGLALGTGCLLILGLYDDLRGLSPLTRLIGAGISGLVLGLTADIPHGAKMVAACVVLVVISVNAVNLLDGADGVAGGAGVVTAAGFALLAWTRSTDPMLALILAGAVGGFLIVNWPPARSFLGDGGAYVLGASLAFLTLTTIPTGEDPMSFGVPLLLVGFSLMGVFLIDLAVTLARRTLSHSPLFGGDRSHVYDQLATRGWRPSAVATAVIVCQLLLVGLIVAFDYLVGPWPAVAATAVVYLLATGALVLAGFISPDDSSSGLGNQVSIGNG